MELPSTPAKKAFNTRRKIEVRMLIVLEKSTHELILSQPLQTIKKRYKIAGTFLIGFSGTYNITNRNCKFSFATPITDKGSFVQQMFAQGAYELESLNDENERNIIVEGIQKQIIHVHSRETYQPEVVSSKFSNKNQ